MIDPPGRGTTPLLPGVFQRGGYLGWMMDLDALIAKGRAQFDTVEPLDQEVLLGDTVVTVRFWPVTGPVWRDLTVKHPARLDSVQDQNLGFNLDGVVRDYPRVFIVDGDTVVSVTEDGKWHDILDVLSGPDLKNLALAVWGLNEYDPQKRLAAAGKASPGGRKKKRA